MCVQVASGQLTAGEKDHLLAHAQERLAELEEKVGGAAADDDAEADAGGAEADGDGEAAAAGGGDAGSAAAAAEDNVPLPVPKGIAEAIEKVKARIAKLEAVMPQERPLSEASEILKVGWSFEWSV